jgi:hypothetical protein
MLVGTGAKTTEWLIGNTKEKIEAIKTNKSEIDERLTDHKIQLFIFIDDIDRLTPIEVAEVFKMIKLSTGFKNTIFFLAYDADFVAGALESVYRTNGKNFLEKIVQVDYTIPYVLSEKMEDIFSKELKKLLDSLKIEYDIKAILERWNYSDLRDYFKTLRHVYRYINSLKLRLPSVKAEVNITDFLLIEAIRIFDYGSFSNLISNYSAIKAASQESILDFFNSNPTSKIVKWLFWGDTSVRLDLFENENRFNNDAYYERYISLQLGTAEVSENDLKCFVLYEDRAGLLRRMEREGRIIDLLTKIGNRKLKEEFSLKNYRYFVDIFNFFDEYPVLCNNETRRMIDAVINLIACNQSISTEINSLIYELTVGRSKLSESRFVFLYYLLLEIESGYPHFFNENDYKKVLEPNIKKMAQSLKYMIENFFDRHMELIDGITFFELNRTFIEAASKFCPNEYKETLFNKITTEKKGVELICQLIVPLTEEGKLFNGFANENLIRQIIPLYTYKDFQKKLFEINPNEEYSERAKVCVDFISGNAKELEKIIDPESKIARENIELLSKIHKQSLGNKN